MTQHHDEIGFVNLGVITRVNRVLLAKAICIAMGYAVMPLGNAVPFGWFAIPMLLASYLLLTGLIGWDPIQEVDDRLSLGRRRQSFRNSTAS